MKDILNEIWSTARRNKLRTALTGFAVVWGIFMLIFLLGAGNGLINASESNNTRYTDNAMQVWGGTTSKPHNGLREGRDIQLDDRDVDDTQSKFTQHIDEVAAVVSKGPMNVVLGGNSFSTNLNGVFPVSAKINKKELLHGRFINDIDMENRRKVMVISSAQAKELTKGDIAALVGKDVVAGAFSFQIVGIYEQSHNSMDDKSFVPYTTMRTMYGMGDKTGSIEFTFSGLDTKEENDAFEKQYKQTLGAKHSIAPNDEDGITVWNHFTQAMMMNTGMGMVRVALWLIGLFTLLSGVVGVGNIMLITVKERTREFGIRKALGATPWSILKLIIVESVLITTFFGYIGMMLGMLANYVMDATIGQAKVSTGLFEATMFLNPTVGFDTCVAATLVIILCGTLAGLIPARKAASIRPIEALRAE